MRAHVFPALLLVAVGCKKDFYAIDDACHEDVPGDARIDDPDAIDATRRTNCYRRLVKLRRGRLDRRVQEATENHLDYMLSQRIWETGEAWNLETAGMGPFTGVDVYERAEFVGYLFDDIGGWGVWELGFLADPFTAEERVDYFVADPFWRQVFLQPDWVDSGYAEGTSDDGMHAAYWTIFYSYPNLEREDRPIVYPRDGQLDVPYRYQSDDPGDSIYPFGEVGFPITVTFSLATTGAFSPTAVNPYEALFDTATLTGPSGEVELGLLTPPGGAGTTDNLRYTIVAVPLTLLEPGADYTFTARVRWGDGRKKELETVFTTAKALDFRSEWQAENLLLSRSAEGGITAPPRPVVQHSVLDLGNP